MKAHKILAKVTAPCEVCDEPKIKGVHWLYLWVPYGLEADLYDKVWVHFGCWKLLLDGARPEGLRKKETA